ncbi:hypothetical protein WJX73_010409 [Symbiochloris irregularis]|uniref:Glycosyltransferase family 92 protein n=1 Tax=Symbiochloris irregularis TaxID=706552 RepID=A0AAW1NYG6_9CHLO
MLRFVWQLFALVSIQLHFTAAWQSSILEPRWSSNAQSRRLQETQRHNHRHQHEAARELQAASYEASMHTSQDTILTDEELAAGSPTNNYILFALHDPKQNVVQAYAEFDVRYVRATHGQVEGEKISSCLFSDQVSRVMVNQSASIWFPEANLHDDLPLDQTVYGVVTCAAPEPKFTHMHISSDINRRLTNVAKMTAIETKRQGSVVGCSQPLHTDRAWLKDWVEHYAAMGVSKMWMHVPRGLHIDAFFNPKLRAQRIAMATQHLEQTPETLGEKPLQKFDHPIAEWHEFQNTPRGSYSKSATFQSCLARARYAYDYIMFFDVDEFLELHHSNPLRGAPLSDYLNKNMASDVASLRFSQYTFPEHCRVLDSGPYADRFLLRQQGTQQYKAIERVAAVNWTHIHGVLELNESWQEANQPDPWPEHYDPLVKEIDVTSAFLKHIRPFGPSMQLENPCAFGAAVLPLLGDDALVLEH